MVFLLRGLASVLLLSASMPQARAVDFKIDLPPAMGVTAPEDEDLLLDIPDFPDNLVENSNGEKSSNLASPDSPPSGLSAWESRGGGGASSAGGHRFPSPACLAANVEFWERVYRDVDKSEVIFHDRNDLGRVYGVASLPASASMRRGAAELYKTYFETKLRELSERMDKPQTWDSAHRDLARHFQKAEWSAERILRASRSIRLQSGLKGQFEEGIQRSLALLPSVQRIVAEEKLPADIVLLPHVESGYHPRAVSKVGAVGLWQIMPDTMRLLLGRSFVSRRTEVEPATRAAAKLLRQNFEATRSWPLALTAYNHGLNGVLKAVRSTGSRDLCVIIERYESPSFRFASSNFYAQFLAARNTALNRYAELARSGQRRQVLRPLLASAGHSGF